MGVNLIRIKKSQRLIMARFLMMVITSTTLKRGIFSKSDSPVKYYIVTTAIGQINK